MALQAAVQRRAGQVRDRRLQGVGDLFSVAEELNVAADRERGFAGIASNDLRLHWLLNNLLLDRLELLERSQIIRAAVPTTSLEWLLSLSDRCKSLKDKRGTAEEGGENLADDETVDWLYAFSLERIRAAAADGTLAQKPEPVALLYGWRDRAGAEEVRAWTDRQLANDAFVVTLAKDLVRESWSTGMGGFGFMGDRVARKTEYVHLEPLQPLLDVARLRERVTTMLKSAGLDAADRLALERFQAAPDRDPMRP